jgi:3-oxoacyl-[acyl-carrier-protein] synthase-1
MNNPINCSNQGLRTVVACAGDIFSPLGYSIDPNAADSVSLNYQAVTQGKSVARTYQPGEHPAVAGLQEAVHASIFPADAIAPVAGYSRLEQMAIRSAAAALRQLPCQPDGARTLFILSSTKGNVASLATPNELPEPELGVSARRVASYFGSTLTPVVVSNACISGVCAQIAAWRALQSGRCDYAVVVGVDELSPFIISGFQSFKALSATDCHPFSADRCGLNLGEAAATIVYTTRTADELHPGDAVLCGGAIRNDANHISGPSRTGEGSFRALQAVIADLEQPAEQLAFVNVHGTATPYNDEMESIALERAGLSSVPINALKGYYGHTLGTAGVLETLLSIEAVRHGTVLATRGFTQLGVSRPVDIAAQLRTTARRTFVKLLSGFGGCNAAIRVHVMP